MDKKFLNKVVNQIVYETEIDYDKEEIIFPFSPFSHTRSYLSLPSFPTFLFTKHCKDIYGLNEQEIKYAWYMYENIINDKINNG